MRLISLTMIVLNNYYYELILHGFKCLFLLTKYIKFANYDNSEDIENVIV